MRKLIFILALFGCSDDNKATIDASMTVAPLTQDCPTYCSAIATACTGDNAQYSAATDSMNCIKTCALFPKGTADDKTGNTLGCRLYHTQNAAMPGNAALHCPHAGPGGAAISTAATQPSTCGDACTSFCALEIAACGSLDTPIAGVPAQYQNAAACMTACGGGTTGFNKSKTYVGVPTPTGDSLACRLYHVTNAAISMTNAVAHCPHTGPNGGMNAATCMAGTTPGP
jgi:hypothetical protein